MSQNQAYSMDDTTVEELCRTLVHDVRDLVLSTELAKGAPKPFLHDSVPAEEDVKGLLSWIYILIQAALKLIQERIKLNHRTYGSSATRALSNNNKAEEQNTDKAEDLKEESVVDAEKANEYETLLKNKKILTQRLKAHEYSNKYQKAKLENELKIIDRRLKELEKEKAASSTYGQESESPADTTSTQEQTEETSSTSEEKGAEEDWNTEEDSTPASADDQESATSEEFIEDGEAHDSLDEEITQNLNDNSCQSNGISSYIHMLMHKQSSECDKLVPVMTTSKEYDTDEVHKLHAEREQNTLCVFPSRPTMVKSIVTDYRDTDGGQVTYSATTAIEIELSRTNTNEVTKIGDDLILRPEYNEEKDALLEASTMAFSEQMKQVLTVSQGTLVFSPSEYAHSLSLIYGQRPCFVRGSISELTMVDLMVTFETLNVGKSGAIRFFDLFSGGQMTNKSHSITLMNGFCRALHALVVLHQNIFFSSCKALHADETFLKCLAMLRHLKTEEGIYRLNNEVWIFVSGKHETVKGAIYFAGKDRSAEECLNLLQSFTITLKILHTDGFKGYPKILRELTTPEEIEHACCFAHLLRYLVQGLIGMGLLELSEAMNSFSAQNYTQELELYIKEKGLVIEEAGKILLKIVFTIKLLLRHERDFAISTAEEMEIRRQKYSKPLMQKLDELMHDLLALSTNIKIVVSKKTGEMRYEEAGVYSWGKGLIYYLNNKVYFERFINNGDIDLTNNQAELYLRSIAFQRNNMEFLETTTGYKAYTELKTLLVTCRMNDVDPRQYFMWVIGNLKMRAETVRVNNMCNDGSCMQIFKMPRRIKKDGKIIDIYDEDYHCIYDDLDPTGLDIWSFINLLYAEQGRYQPSTPKDSAPDAADGQ